MQDIDIMCWLKINLFIKSINTVSLLLNFIVRLVDIITKRILFLRIWCGRKTLS